MWPKTSPRRKRSLAACVIARGGRFIVVMAALAGCRSGPQVANTAAYLSISADGMRYFFHPATRQDLLYDLRHDRHCLKNLSHEQPAVTKNMRRRLETLLGVASLDELKADGFAERNERLRALGYL